MAKNGWCIEESKKKSFEEENEEMGNKTDIDTDVDEWNESEGTRAEIEGGDGEEVESDGVEGSESKGTREESDGEAHDSDEVEGVGKDTIRDDKIEKNLSTV